MKIKMALFLFIILPVVAIGEIKLDVEFIVPGSMSSNHVVKNGNTIEKNGGRGIRVGPLIYMEFVNSFGDFGKLYAIQPIRLELELPFFRGGIGIWLMEIHGYKDKNGDPYISRPPPYPVFNLAFNPIWFVYKDFWITCHKLYFFSVSIEFWAINFYTYRF